MRIPCAAFPVHSTGAVVLVLTVLVRVQGQRVMLIPMPGGREQRSIPLRYGPYVDFAELRGLRRAGIADSNFPGTAEHVRRVL